MERPILFSAAMVRAILEGRKTQTRRLVKPQIPPGFEPCGTQAHTGAFYVVTGMNEKNGVLVPKSPYGVPGGWLWVREAWAVHKLFDKRPGGELTIDKVESIHYCCDYDDHRPAPFGRYRHGRFMPRWACRLVLEVTGVRVERLQEISGEDAKAEGAEYYVGGEGIVSESDLRTEPGYWHGIDGYRSGFEMLWDSLNAKRAPWESNPWVWCVEFKVSK